MFFYKEISYYNKNKNTLDEFFQKFANKTSFDIKYLIKKEKNQIIMKPINNWIVYNSFKPIIRIFCFQDSIILKFSFTKSTVITLLIAIIFVILLDFLTVFMKLYQDTDWVLALFIVHFCFFSLICAAILSLEYFYKKIILYFREIL